MNILSLRLHFRARAGATLGLMLGLATVASAQDRQPAKFKSGPMPPGQALGVGGGEVLLEVTVSEQGTVTATKPLRATGPFTDAMATAVQGWQFDPAKERTVDAAGVAHTVPVGSKVVVAGFFRPPAMVGPTLGEPIKQVGTSSADAPSVLHTSMPPYPALALNPGSVLIEVDLDTHGAATVRALRPAPPFDDVSVTTVKSWSFAPARVGGVAVSSRVYAFFNFPQPVLTP